MTSDRAAWVRFPMDHPVARAGAKARLHEIMVDVNRRLHAIGLLTRAELTECANAQLARPDVPDHVKRDLLADVDLAIR